MTTAIHDFLFETLTMKAVGIFLGLALISSHAYALLKRDQVQAILKAFPRDRRSGVVLTIVNALLAFVLMIRGHVCLNILGHESAHRLLFSNRRANDWVGRFLAYSSYQAMLA